MKNLKTTITTLLISLVTVMSFGQKSSVWATVENVEQLQKNQQFISILTDLHTDLTYYKAFASSKQEKLYDSWGEMGASLEGFTKEELIFSAINHDQLVTLVNSNRNFFR